MSITGTIRKGGEKMEYKELEKREKMMKKGKYHTVKCPICGRWFNRDVGVSIHLGLKHPKYKKAYKESFEKMMNELASDGLIEQGDCDDE